VDILIYGITNSIVFHSCHWICLVYSISSCPNFCSRGASISLRAISYGYLSTRPAFPICLSAAGLAATSLIGALIYRFIIMRISGMEISEIIGTYAIGLAIIEGCGGRIEGMTYTLPAFVAGSTEIGGVSIDYQRLIIIGIGDTDLHPSLFIHPIQQGSVWPCAGSRRTNGLP